MLALAELLQRGGLGRLDEIGYELRGAGRGGVGIWGLSGWGAVEFSQTTGQTRQRLRPLELLLPRLHRDREERGMAVEVPLLDDRTSFLCSVRPSGPGLPFPTS